ncbi:MAG: ribose-5-phosphate isomerase [Propionicimonas sp.]
MRIHIGSDHAGFDLKQYLLQHLADQGHEVVDHGAAEYDEADDYPVYCLRAAEGVAADPGALGIVLGGSGNGEQLAANEVPGVRAALVWSAQTAELARAHNDASVIAIGARMHTLAEAATLVDIFLRTPFSKDPRHVRRLAMLSDYEEHRRLPPLPEGRRD